AGGVDHLADVGEIAAVGEGAGVQRKQVKRPVGCQDEPRNAATGEVIHHRPHGPFSHRLQQERNRRVEGVAGVLVDVVPAIGQLEYLPVAQVRQRHHLDAVAREDEGQAAVAGDGVVDDGGRNVVGHQALGGGAVDGGNGLVGVEVGVVLVDALE